MIRFAGMLAGLVCFYQAYVTWDAKRVQRYDVPTSVTRASIETDRSPQSELKTIPISDLRPGMRVLASNPELEGSRLGQSEIDGSWRLVTLRMANPGGHIDIKLLRPVRWLLAHAVEIADAPVLGIGQSDDESEIEVERTIPYRTITLDQFLIARTIHLDLAEMGASGPASITHIAPCPPIERQGPNPDRHVITGTFHHSAGNLIDLKIEGETKPIGVTDNHPFWSEDRQAFVPAGQLSPGEHLRRADGTVTQVTRIHPRRGPPVEVFNLEVDAQHVYYVGERGTLVHNSYLQNQVLNETASGVGDFTSRFRLSENDALGAATRWLGPGSRELGRSGSGVYLSADGLRRFRMDVNSLMGRHRPNIPHVHFEWLSAATDRIPYANNHVPIF